MAALLSAPRCAAPAALLRAPGGCRRSCARRCGAVAVRAAAGSPSPLQVRLVKAANVERDGGLADVRAALDEGADPNAAVAAGRNETWTPLMCAAQSDSPAVLALLAARGGDVNARTPGGWKLECPAESHSYNMLSLDVTTPLLTAALAGAEAATRALLKLGADPRERHLDEYWDWQRAWSVAELAAVHAKSAAEAEANPIVTVLRAAAAAETAANTPLRCLPPPDPLAGAASWEKTFPGVKRPLPRNPPGDGGFGAPWDNGLGEGADAVRAKALAARQA